MASLKVEDVAPHGYAIDRATVRRGKTGRPVKFEVTEKTRQAVDDYLKATRKAPGDFLFTGHRDQARCFTTRQYACLLIYRRTGNLRAVRLDGREASSSVGRATLAGSFISNGLRAGNPPCPVDKDKLQWQPRP